MEHTKEPWYVHDQQLHYAITDSQNPNNPKWNIGRFFTRSDAERTIACINACEGINPEAVPDLLEAAKALLNGVESVESYKGDITITFRNEQALFHAFKLARIAVAKAEEK